MTTPLPAEAAADRSLSILVHGDTKVGKSTLAISAPYPRLMLDVEGGNKFLNIQRKKWDPKREDPPVADGTWDTCVVDCRDYETLLKVYQWLNLGRHQFNSLIIDSLSELQTKALESIAGRGQVQTQQWGELARAFTGMMRDLRDLTTHPTKPLQAVILTAMTKQDKDGKWVPFLMGQSATVAPFLFDLVGYLAKEEYPHPDPTQGTYKVRRMHIEGSNRWQAGERVQGRLGVVVEQGDLSIDRMLDIIYGPQDAVTHLSDAATVD